MIYSDTEALTPTPLYNHTLATNQIFGSGEQLTADWSNESDVIKQCMVLTKIWMYQRHLDKVSSYSVASGLFGVYYY